MGVSTKKLHAPLQLRKVSAGKRRRTSEIIFGWAFAQTSDRRLSASVKSVPYELLWRDRALRSQSRIARFCGHTAAARSSPLGSPVFAEHNIVGNGIVV